MDSGSTIDVKLISGKDLKAFNFFQKLTIYAQVSIFSDDPDKKLKPDQKQQQRSPADRDNDGNPEWNHQMLFRFNSNEDSDHLFLQFELFSEGVVFGDKPIGEVRVPISDLIRDSDGIVRFVSYQVRSPDGKSNGVLDFSFKVNVGFRSETETDFPVTSVSGHMAGCPATHNHIHLHHHNISLYPPVEFDHVGPPLIPYPPPSTEAGYYPPPETYYPPPPLVHHLPPPPPPHALHHWGSSPYLGGYDYGDQGSPRPNYHHFHSSSWNGDGR